MHQVMPTKHVASFLSHCITPFFANKGYHLSITIHAEHDIASTYARDLAVDLQQLHHYLCKAITGA